MLRIKANLNKDLVEFNSRIFNKILGIFLLLKVLSHYIGIKVTVLDTLLITIGLQLVTFTIKLSDE